MGWQWMNDIGADTTTGYSGGKRKGHEGQEMARRGKKKTNKDKKSGPEGATCIAGIPFPGSLGEKMRK